MLARSKQQQHSRSKYAGRVAKRPPRAGGLSSHPVRGGPRHRNGTGERRACCVYAVLRYSTGRITTEGAEESDEDGPEACGSGEAGASGMSRRAFGLTDRQCERATLIPDVHAIHVASQ